MSGTAVTLFQNDDFKYNLQATTKVRYVKYMTFKCYALLHQPKTCIRLA